MEHVDFDEVTPEPNPMGVHEDRRPVGRLLGAEDVALVYYELEPGESFSGGMHRHHDQEEIFLVRAGTATFERPEGEDDVEVAAGEAVRFGPGEWQMGRNDPATGEETVRALAVGAPDQMHDFGELESLNHCRDCDEETAHRVDLTDDYAFELTCTECGTEWTIGGAG